MLTSSIWFICWVSLATLLSLQSLWPPPMSHPCNARWLMHRGLTDPSLSRVMIQDELKELRPDLSNDELETIEKPAIEDMEAIYKQGQNDKREQQEQRRQQSGGLFWSLTYVCCVCICVCSFQCCAPRRPTKRSCLKSFRAPVVTCFWT